MSWTFLPILSVFLSGDRRMPVLILELKTDHAKSRPIFSLKSPESD